MSESRRTPLMIVFVTVFIDLLGFGIVLPLLPRYAEAFNATPVTLGLLMASFSAMQFLCSPLWGRLSDRVGRRPVLLVGLAGSTICYGLFGFASSLGTEEKLAGFGALAWLFVSRIGAGIAGATIPTAQAYIADTTGRKERTRGMALIGMAFGIGFTFGPLIGAAFVSDDPTAPPSPGAGYAAACLSGLAFLWALVKLPESLKPGESESAGAFHLAAIGSAVRLPGIALLLLVMFLTTFAFSQFESTLSLLTEAMEVADRGNFFVFAYVGFTLALCQGGIVRRMATRMSPERLATIGTTVMVVGLGLIALAGNLKSPGMLYGFLPIAVLGFSAVTPSLQSILSLRTSEDRQGEIMGVAQSMSSLARILGPMAAMPLHKVNVPLPHLCGAGLMAVGLVLVLMLGKSSEAAITEGEASTQDLEGAEERKES